MRRHDRLADRGPGLDAQQTRRAARRAAAMTAAALLAVVAGCGSGDSSSAAQGDDSTPSSPSGSTTSPPVRIAVIGDSIPFGGEDCGGCTPFIDLYASELGEQAGGRTVDPTNLSTYDGLTSPQLLTRIQTEDYYRDAVAEADILVVSTGHNDTPWAVTTDSCDGDSGDEPVWSTYRRPCLTRTAAEQAGLLTEFLEEARRLRDGEPTVQVVLTVYNDWIGWDEAPPEATKASAATLDAFYRAECRAARRAGAVCLDSYHAFNGPDGLTPAGELLGPDYTHPSQQGHNMFARLLADVDVSAVTGS